MLGVAVSITSLIGFVFVVYDRTRPTGPPEYRAAITSTEKAAELVRFLKEHDGETVELVLDCDDGDESHCFSAPPDIKSAFEGFEPSPFEVLFLYEGDVCTVTPNDEGCVGGWWVFLGGDAQGQVYNRAGAGTLRITGSWGVRLGGLSGVVGPNTFALDAVKNGQSLDTPRVQPGP